MNLAQVHRVLASDRLGLTPTAMERLTAALFHDPELFAASGLQVDGTGQYSNAQPTAGALALLIIGASVGQPPSEAWHSAVQLHWHAQCWTQETNDNPRLPRPRCPITGHAQLGRALTFILSRPLCASRVVRIEVSAVCPIWTLWSRLPEETVQRTVFVAAHARELHEGLEALPRAASTSLPGATLLELAKLLVRVQGRRLYLK